MKNIANILTFLRIVLALILLIFFKEASLSFLIIYSIAEFTDIIDGTIARKTGSCSPTGALLDSIADFLLLTNLVKMVLSMHVMTKKLFIWMCIALGIGVLSPIISFIKHKKVFFIHSIPCKICGGIITIVPFAVYFGFAEPYIAFALAIITLAMIEIVIMSVMLDKPDPDAKSIYSIIKKNKATQSV